MCGGMSVHITCASGTIEQTPLTQALKFPGPPLARNCAENAYIVSAHWKGRSEEMLSKGGEIAESRTSTDEKLQL